MSEFVNTRSFFPLFFPYFLSFFFLFFNMTKAAAPTLESSELPLSYASLPGYSRHIGFSVHATATRSFAFFPLLFPTEHFIFLCLIETSTTFPASAEILLTSGYCFYACCVTRYTNGVYSFIAGTLSRAVCLPSESSMCCPWPSELIDSRARSMIQRNSGWNNWWCGLRRWDKYFAGTANRLVSSKKFRFYRDIFVAFRNLDRTIEYLFERLCLNL